MEAAPESLERAYRQEATRIRAALAARTGDLGLAEDAVQDAFLEAVDRAIDREAPIDTQIDQAIDTYLGLVTGDPDLMATFASPALGEPTVVAMRDGFERYAELIVAVVESDSARDPRVAPISVERAYMLVSGLHQTLVRALVRGEDLGPASYEFKAVMKLVLSGA